MYCICLSPLNDDVVPFDSIGSMAMSGDGAISIESIIPWNERVAEQSLSHDSIQKSRRIMTLLIL